MLALLWNGLQHSWEPIHRVSIRDELHTCIHYPASPLNAVNATYVNACIGKYEANSVQGMDVPEQCTCSFKISVSLEKSCKHLGV